MSENGKAQRPPLPALTSIRFLFAMMVAATHFQGYRPEIAPSSWSPLGSTAVSWFFILSGFILAYSSPRLDGGAGAAKFVASRFWRLFPVQAVTLLASFLLFQTTRHIVQAEPEYLAFSLSLTQSWMVNPTLSQAFNPPAWSISHEWFFYLMFPLMIGRPRIAWLAALVGGAFALAWASRLGCWQSQAVFQSPGDSFAPTCYQLVYYWPPARLWEFALGMGLCSIATHMRARAPAYTQVILIATAVALFAFRHDIEAAVLGGFFQSFFGSWAIDTAVGAAVILALALSGPVSRALSARALVFAGEISFSIYMTHMLVLRYADMKQIGETLPLAVQTGAFMAFICAVSAVVYLGVEEPSRRWLKRILSDGSRLRLLVARR